MTGTATQALPTHADRGVDHDVIVVGAGLGGINAVRRFTEVGLSVLGIEEAGGVGGVWHHNRYPGARVDVDSLDYCYYSAPDLWQKWRWSERNAAQPELQAYLDFAADTFGVKGHFLFDTRVVSAEWSPDAARYHVTTSSGDRYTCRFLVMTTGQLSAARRPDFPGLDRFRGRWVQTNQWPHDDVDVDGPRIAVIGTGSSGVQAATALAERAGQLYVFQRTANYAVPARNRPLVAGEQKAIAERLEEEREKLHHTPGGSHIPVPEHEMAHYTEAERNAIMEAQWAFGGQGFNFMFLDQGRNQATNDVVSEFARNKIRTTVRDPQLAEKLCPTYPIGTRRLILDTGYYEIYNQDNVSLIDVAADPIVEITESGIRTQQAQVEVDLIVFALGFHAFTGALDGAKIRNERGLRPTAGWQRGPRTMLGLMTTGFPNLFLPTGPGSPSVLGNLFLQNEFTIDWVADCISYLDAHGHRTIEPTQAAEDAWTAHVAECASGLLRLQVDNYMVHVNRDDGSRVFIPYTGGVGRYVEAARRSADQGYDGFTLR